MRAQFPDADAVVFGHSHIPLQEERDGFQIFNPGSPTDKRRQPRCTMGIGEVDRGRIRFRLVPLD
jgi:predicted phosphodiesterase